MQVKVSKVYINNSNIYYCHYYRFWNLSTHCPSTLHGWVHDLRSFSEYNLSHFFLSKAVDQWINKWVQHHTGLPEWFIDGAGLKKIFSQTDETETSWKKAHNNSTNYKHCCLEGLVLFGRSFHFPLGQLLCFYLPSMAAGFMIQNHICEGNKHDEIVMRLPI